MSLRDALLQEMDLDRTAWCPHGSCEICGAKNDVTTVTFGSRLGVACLRACRSCLEMSQEPPVRGTVETMDRVIDHCAHLGISLDEMAQVLAYEAGQVRS